MDFTDAPRRQRSPGPRHGDGDEPGDHRAGPRRLRNRVPANTTSLWTTGTAGEQDWRLGMMPGASPGIAGLRNGTLPAVSLR